MQRTRQTLRQWTKQHGPAVLPTLAAGALALAIASHVAELVGRQPAPSGWAGYVSSWLYYIPEWLSKGFLICIVTGLAAFMAYQIAREYRTEANSAAAVGSMTVAVLAWGTQSCSTAGSIAGWPAECRPSRIRSGMHQGQGTETTMGNNRGMVVVFRAKTGELRNDPVCPDSHGNVLRHHRPDGNIGLGAS